MKNHDLSRGDLVEVGSHKLKKFEDILGIQLTRKGRLLGIQSGRAAVEFPVNPNDFSFSVLQSFPINEVTKVEGEK